MSYKLSISRIKVNTYLKKGIILLTRLLLLIS